MPTTFARGHARRTAAPIALIRASLQQPSSRIRTRCREVDDTRQLLIELYLSKTDRELLIVRATIA
jgi:hypothetical protein